MKIEKIFKTITIDVTHPTKSSIYISNCNEFEIYKGLLVYLVKLRELINDDGMFQVLMEACVKAAQDSTRIEKMDKVMNEDFFMGNSDSEYDYNEEDEKDYDDFSEE